MADVLGVGIFTYADWMRGRGGAQRGRICLPGPGRRGRGQGGGASVSEAVYRCLRSRTPLRTAVNVNGNHWHVLFPVDASGRVVTMALGDDARAAFNEQAMEDAARYVRSYAPPPAHGV